VTDGIRPRDNRDPGSRQPPWRAGGVHQDERVGRAAEPACSRPAVRSSTDRWGRVMDASPLSHDFAVPCLLP